MIMSSGKVGFQTRSANLILVLMWQNSSINMLPPLFPKQKENIFTALICNFLHIIK